MKWLGLSVIAVGCVAGGCDKTVPFELTVPAAAVPVTASAPSIDAGRSLLDAQVGADASDASLVAELPNVPFSKPGLLKAIADCSLARYREFNERAGTLRDASNAWAAAPTADSRTAAQNAFLLALGSWQQSELFRFGPTGPSSEPGGQDLRDSIYFFPDLDDCLIDQQLVSKAYQAAPFALSVSSKGLGALEYLLFYDGATNACASSLPINTGTPSPWAQLSTTELAARRAAYAGAVATDLASTAKTVLDAWDPAVGNFHAQLSNAGTAQSTTYKTDRDAFNAIDHALFYVDRELADFKLAIPIGASTECSTGTCPDAVESRFSLATNSNIVENLRGFRELYQGCGADFSGLGFDDYLVSVGKLDLASRLTAAAQAAQQSADTLPLPLGQMLTTDPVRLRALYDSVEAVSTLLAGEFVSALGLELPASATGDNH